MKSLVRLHLKKADFNPTQNTLVLHKGTESAECKVTSAKDKSNYYELELDVPVDFIFPGVKYEVSIL